jgi:hypothetical protein
MHRFIFALAILFATFATAEGAQRFDCDNFNCDCTGTGDCRDMNQSGMCTGVTTCQTSKGILHCTCQTAKSGGGVSKQPPAATGTRTNKQ